MTNERRGLHWSLIHSGIRHFLPAFRAAVLGFAQVVAAGPAEVRVIVEDHAVDPSGKPLDADHGTQEEHEHRGDEAGDENRVCFQPRDPALAGEHGGERGGCERGPSGEDVEQITRAQKSQRIAPPEAKLFLGLQALERWQVAHVPVNFRERRNEPESPPAHLVILAFLLGGRERGVTKARRREGAKGNTKEIL